MQDENKLTREWIRSRFAIEGAIAEVSRLLLSSNDIELKNVLEIVGKAISVNCSCILRYNKDKLAIDRRYLWGEKSPNFPEPELEGLDILRYPWVMQRIRQDENVMIADVEVLPPEASLEKADLKSHGIRSILIIPIFSTNKEFVGTINFACTDGRREWLGEEVQALRVVAEMISIYWDRRKAKEALADSEERYRRLYEESKKGEEVYRSLLNSSPDAIVISDLEGRTRYVSPMFSRIFGWPQEELEGVEIPYVPVIDRISFKEILKRVISDGSSCQGLETKRLTKDGRLLDVSLSVSRYDDHNGKPFGVLFILRDMSERKKLESQLVQAQKMEAVGTLAGGIAHDFNNILQAILGCTEILLMGKGPGHSAYDKLKTIEKSAQKARNLAKRLLVFSRKMESEFVPLDINHEIEQFSEILERTIPKMIRIQLSLEENLQMINADPVEFEQIVMNIAINARDAMPDGGVLTIKTEHSILDRKFCSVNPGSIPGKYTLLSIIDTGYGIDEETLNHIYEPFFTTKDKPEGTGLGLAMVYGIVKKHGGYITCSSKINKGTIFNIYFPIIEGDMESSREGEMKIDNQGGNETILFVDDDETNRELGEEILTSFGYKVIQAADGESALESYQNNKEKISLVLLDLIMPGIGGQKCMEELIRLDPEVKVIVSSGYSSSSWPEEALRLGAKDFISKPYNIKQMLKAVRKVLG